MKNGRPRIGIAAFLGPLLPDLSISPTRPIRLSSRARAGLSLDSMLSNSFSLDSILFARVKKDFERISHFRGENANIVAIFVLV